MKAQLQGLEEQLTGLKTSEAGMRQENGDLSRQLAGEQAKAIALTKEVTANSTSKQALSEAKEKVRDLERENDILRESNEKLLDSAYNVERERKFVASENALKVTIL